MTTAPLHTLSPSLDLPRVGPKWLYSLHVGVAPTGLPISTPILELEGNLGKIPGHAGHKSAPKDGT